MAVRTYDKDLAVSFAGAQRSYVQQYVSACEQLGLTVFYDRNMEVELWGRDLIVEFRKVYGGTRARFFVPFLSAEYLSSPYPMDEFAAATEQAFHRGDEPYILPIRVGGVTIPSELIRGSVLYIDADGHTPEALAAITARRVTPGLPSPANGPAPRAVPAAHVRPPSLRRPHLTPTSFDSHATLASILEEVGARLEEAGPTLEPYGFRCSVERTEQHVFVHVRYVTGAPICALALRRDDTLGHDQLAMNFSWPRLDTRGMNGWVRAVWDPAAEAPAAELTDLSDFTAGGASRRLTAGELFEVLWDKVVDLLERKTW